jgi:hypothetical protein
MKILSRLLRCIEQHLDPQPISLGLLEAMEQDRLYKEHLERVYAYCAQFALPPVVFESVTNWTNPNADFKAGNQDGHQ